MYFSISSIRFPAESLLPHFLKINPLNRCQCPFFSPRLTLLSCSMRPRPRSRRRRKKLTKQSNTSSSVPKLETVVDINHLSAKTSSSFRTLFASPDSSVHRFLSLGKEAYRDLQTFITLDDNRGVVISCHRSTVQFVGTLAVWSIFLVFAFRVLINLGSRFRNHNGGGYSPVVRRDRSLGGREVIVGTRGEGKRDAKYNVKMLDNPLSPVQAVMNGIKRELKNRVRVGQRLPKWWSTPVKRTVPSDYKREYQREANRVVRGLVSILF